MAFSIDWTSFERGLGFLKFFWVDTRRSKVDMIIGLIWPFS